MKNKFCIKQTDNCKVFFTSDTHFWHANIIKYCNRPFKSIEDMNESLISAWNRCVRPTDIVFHLGDFAFCSSEKLKDIISRLNGTIYLTMGNHDFKMFKHESAKKMFADVEQQYYIEVDGQKILLNHFPMLCFGGSHRTTNQVWQLFGHVHSGPYNLIPEDITKSDLPRLEFLQDTQYDVGVDNNNFAPISFDTVKEIMKLQETTYEKIL